MNMVSGNELKNIGHTSGTLMVFQHPANQPACIDEKAIQTPSTSNNHGQRGSTRCADDRAHARERSVDTADSSF